MKNLRFKIFLLFVAGFPFVVFPVFATDFTLICPRKTNNFESSIFCGKSKNYELLVSENFSKNEIPAFDEILKSAFADNQRNPEFIVQKLVHELRIHRECLRETCIDVLRKCGENINLSENFNQEEICRGLIEKVMFWQKAKIEITAIQNQSRKERSLLRQKFTAISERFIPWIHKKMGILTQNFVRFAGKLTNFVSFPTE